MSAQGITKTFNRRPVLQNISFSLAPGESLAITGRNGAGKSTLLKILAGVLSPSGGTVNLKTGESAVGDDILRTISGFVAPYLQLYDEFSPKENLSILARIRSSRQHEIARSEELLRMFGLWNRRDDAVRTFSSGMKQRLKYVVALEHDPMLLFLDEPTSNLDEEGSTVVNRIVKDFRQDGILIIATNNEDEAAWCRKRVQVGE